MTKTLKLSTLAFASVMTGSLLLGGCGNKNKAPGAAKLEKVQKRTVSEAEASKALKAMALDSSGAGALSWAARDGKAGNYTFHDVTLKNDKEGDAKIGALELLGVHMQDDQPVFDKIAFKDVTIKDIEDGKPTDVTFGHISIVKPSPALSAAFAQAFRGDEDAFNKIEGDIGFKAVSFADMSVSDKDVNMAIKSMQMGENDDKTGVFALKNVSIDSKKGDDVTLRLASMDVTGANLQKYKALFKASMKDGKSDKAMADFMQNMNVYDPDFRHADLKGLDMDIKGIKISLDSYVADITKKGDKLVGNANLSPLRITVPKDSSDKGIKKFREALDTMGYDSLEFTSKSHSEMDEKTDSLKASDSWIEMKDGFRLSYDMDMTGYKAFMEQAMALQAEQAKNGGKKSNPMAAMGMMGALKINNMRLALKDESLIDRSFKLAAAQKGGTPEALKTQAKAMLGFLAMAAKDEAQQKLAQDVGTAVSELIDNGGTLVIDINPKQPLNLMQLGMGAAGGKVDVAALGITVSHE